MRILLVVACCLLLLHVQAQSEDGVNEQQKDVDARSDIFEEKFINYDNDEHVPINPRTIFEATPYKRYRHTDTCYCGVSNANVNGLNVFPWTVRVTSGMTNLTQAYQCDGALINDQFVLTSARSIYDIPATNVILVKIIRMVSPTLGGYVRLVLAKTYSTNFNPTNSLDDVVLLRIARVPFGNGIGPVCLPNPFNPIIGATSFASSWDNGTTATTTLQYSLSFPLLSSQCSALNSNYSPTSNVCALHFGINIPSGCHSDRGGPLTAVYYNSTYVQNRHQLIGVGSKALGCVSSPVSYGFYAHVPSNLDFIYNVTANATYCRRENPYPYFWTIG